ncbi:MAG: carbohydrate ABC transporter permease [Acidimicrobiia bacterium]
MGADAVALQRSPRTNRLAVAAVVAGAVGPAVGLPLWFANPPLGGVVVLLGWSLALAFGYSARGQIRMSNGAESGDEIARVGITLGFVELGVLVLVMVLLVTIAEPIAGLVVAALTAGLLLALLLGNARLVGRYVLLTLLAAVVLFPIYITVVNSLLRPEQIAARPPTIVPTDPQWDSYSEAWSAGHMATYLRNSFIVTIIITVGQIVTAVLAGYAFAFLQFPLKRTLFVVFLSTLMVPFEVTIITNLQTVDSLGWLNTYQGLAVPFLATGFGAFLLRQAFLQVPRDLQDAAAMDGYGHLRFMVRVAVPLARPAIAALSVFAFLAAWNQYLWPLLVTEDDQYRTVQIGLKQLRGTQLNDINVTFAGVIIAAVPLLILLIFFQKQLVRGLTAGAVKG